MAGGVQQAQDAIAELARVWRRYEGDPDGAIRAITETAAGALGTGRASVWLLNEDETDMTCIDLYEAAERRHSAGVVVRAADFPAYFAALLQEETIAADDAHTDPRTAEFSLTYLGPLGIGSLLDAPIRTGMRLVGVLCHEHIGGAREWSPGERKDGAFLASLASLTLELKNRAMREALLAATLESTGEGILATDESRVVAFNQRFVEMWKIDLPTLRSFDAVRRHIAARTSLSGAISDANEAFAIARSTSGGSGGDVGAVGAGSDVLDILELDDGRVFERTSRPQIMAEKVIGRVWSFRDVTAQRRAEAALRASEARMRDLATRDGLTGLFNRRHVLDQLDGAIARAVAAGERLSVALLDLDHFKRINDELGHLAGDAVLRDFARQLDKRVRSSDLVGRYGGEEFVVVFKTAPAAAARRVIEQVREVLRERDLDGLPRYSFSCGIAELGTDGGGPTELLGRADERLYEAKRAGRDRTV